MNYETIVRLTSEAMLLCLLLSLPAVLVAAGVGLLVAFVQAITSIQDQSIGQAAKAIAVALAVVLAAPWAAATILRFAQSSLRAAFV
jgi:type III secretion protein S